MNFCAGSRADMSNTTFCSPIPIPNIYREALTIPNTNTVPDVIWSGWGAWSGWSGWGGRGGWGGWGGWGGKISKISKNSKFFKIFKKN